MSTEVALGTPLAEALSGVVQPKLVEMGWSSDGGEDSALTEYVILMLVNGKTQDQIAEELSNDLLNLGEGDTQALDFSRWLFEQVDILKNKINGTAPVADSNSAATQPLPASNEQQLQSQQVDQEDANMGDGSVPSDTIPTGPRAMRNNNNQRGRGRLLNQINKNLERGPDAMLHRVRNQQNNGRINTHGQNFQKGPRGQHGAGRFGQNRQMGGMGAGQMQGPGAANVMQMSPENQMQLMAMLEEQARMMSQLMPGFMPPAVNPNFQNQQQQQGRSLFDRIERPGKRQGGNFQSRASQNGNEDADMDMTEDHQTTAADGQANTDSVCRFNLRCTRKDCPYAHQSPAAPEGAPVDVTDTCSFGAACKNRKCTGRHPSPAVKASHQAEEICRFFPHCANPHCSFKHPSMPLCRNGADCSTEGCKFTHLTTACKFNPCMNPTCPYKHAEGQKGSFPDKVWIAGQENKPHVSERKFVEDENGEEELIKPDIPAAAAVDSAQTAEQVIT